MRLTRRGLLTGAAAVTLGPLEPLTTLRVWEPEGSWVTYTPESPHPRVIAMAEMVRARTQELLRAPPAEKVSVVFGGFDSGRRYRLVER